MSGGRRTSDYIGGILISKESPEIVQAWLICLSPELGDQVPLRLLREEPVAAIADDLHAAARVMAVFGSAHRAHRAQTDKTRKVS